MSFWLWLMAAIGSEVAGTLALRQLATGLRAMPVVLVVAGYTLSFACMIPALRTISVGVSYAVWSATGTAAVSGLGTWLFGDRLNGSAIVGMALIVAGVVLMTTSGSVTHGT